MTVLACFKVVLQATLGRNYTEGIAIDDVTVTDGLCDEEIDLQSSPQGLPFACNFNYVRLNTVKCNLT